MIGAREGNRPALGPERQDSVTHDETETSAAVPRRRRPFLGRIIFLSILTVLAALAWIEARSSRLQARILSGYGRKLTWHVAPGRSDSIHFPAVGPYDIRRGYALLPAVTDSLKQRGFAITRQARFSKELLRVARLGLYPTYREKTSTGLRILDEDGRPFYAVTYPGRTYASFETIPPLVVRTLLFIENRELLDERHPFRNPAVEWDRLAKASFDLLLHTVLPGHNIPGGSTLATQIEKFRHSDEGRTSDPRDKLRQMASASLRAYLEGENTLEERRRIVLDFVNSVPLAAIPGYGEVSGLGDGLWAWFEVDTFEGENRLLDFDPTDPGIDRLTERAQAFRRVLSLFIAHRRPSIYLVTGRAILKTDTESYIRLMHRAGLISAPLRDAALAANPEFRNSPPIVTHESFVDRKAANAMRARLLAYTGIEQLYDLDRLDLTTGTTLDRTTQKEVTRALQRLKEPAYADSIGLRGARLLQRGDPAGVIYSFTLYERVGERNLLRIQADNFDQPFDINEGVKLDLGSTAKLRTLVTYLEVIARVHAEHAGRSPRDLRALKIDRQDNLTRWTVNWLATAPDTSLGALMEAAMNRTYSGSPGESFFTGGGLHRFSNFEPEDNAGSMPVRNAVRHSVNLVFIRMMRDIRQYYAARLPDYDLELLEDRENPKRQAYLSRFADKEGREFLARFYRKYRGKSPEECLDVVVGGLRATPKRLTIIFRSILPNAPFETCAAFVRKNDRRGIELSDETLRPLYEQFPKTAFDLADRGYLAGLHPLELWLVEFLHEHPGSGWQDVVAASGDERQTVYKWLFNSRSREGQNSRIRVLLELDAFKEIHAAWARLGYPFGSLVPSLATSIGSSADRPAALAELAGIINAGGIRYPTTRIGELHFAAGTPYETVFERRLEAGERLLPAELCTVVKAAMVDVVQSGTARRAYQAFQLPDGGFVPVGGKTGTGDHRFETFGKGGRLLDSRVVNRAGCFVFVIGDRFHGTITAYVPGAKAADYRFTSALPVQVLKSLAPALAPLITREYSTSMAAATAPADTLEREPAEH